MTMKRRLIQVPVIMLLGVIINVAVTVLICILGDFYVDSTELSEAECAQLWKMYAAPDWPKHVIGGERSFGFGGTIASVEFEEGDSSCSIEEGRIGWPCFAVIAARNEAPDGEVRYYGTLAMQIGGLDQIPCIPVWPGFAINAIFYGTIMWLPFVILGRIRRWRRVARGRCPNCGYPIGASAVCTECGKAVNVPKQLEIGS